MKLAIVGSRTFNDYALLKETIKSNNLNITEIVSGGARGADSLAEKFAIDNDIQTTIYKADWKTHGKAAGFIRNHDIIKNSDIVLAFWDGISNGTRHSISLAEKHNKRLIVVKF